MTFFGKLFFVQVFFSGTFLKPTGARTPLWAQVTLPSVSEQVVEAAMMAKWVQKAQNTRLPEVHYWRGMSPRVQAHVSLYVSQAIDLVP